MACNIITSAGSKIMFVIRSLFSIRASSKMALVAYAKGDELLFMPKGIVFKALFGGSTIP